MLGILFSRRGRITRAELLLGTFAWLFAIVIALYTTLSAAALGYTWALYAYFGFAMVALSSMQAMATQRAHDLGHGYWYSVRHPFTSFRRSMVEPNAYGPPPARGRVWLFLGVLMLLGIAGVAASSLVVRRYATAFCTPSVSVSAATKADAELRWKDAVKSTHGGDYLTGNTVGYSATCRNGECTVSGRACRRP